MGHETDTTIADLVADVRAATPTAAAELSVPLLSDELIKIDQLKLRLVQSYARKVEILNQRLSSQLNSYIFNQPQRLYEGYAQKLDLLTERLVRAMEEKNQQLKNDLNVHMLQLNAQNPTQLVKQKYNDLNGLSRQLTTQMEWYMENQNKRFHYAVQSLDYLSPLKIMNRGYSYATKDGKVIKNSNQVVVEDKIHIHLHKGNFEAKVIKKDEESK